MKESVLIEMLYDALDDLARAAEAVAAMAEVKTVPPTPKFYILGRTLVWPLTAGGRTYWMLAGVDEETFKRLEQRWPPRARRSSILQSPGSWYRLDDLDHFDALLDNLMNCAPAPTLVRVLHVLRCAAGWARAVAEGDFDRAAEFLAAAQKDPDPELEAEVALRVLGEEF